MKTIKAQPLDREAFAKYGVFQDLLDNGGPSGHAVKPSYAGYLKATLNSLMRYAIKEGYLLANPLDGTEHIPVRAPEKDDVPSAADVKALLDALDCRDGRQMCVYLCATLGLRRSEALGLRWGDVDFEKKAVNIRVSLQADRTLGKLKTAESRRTLPMPDYLADALGIRQAAAKADLKVSKANSLINEIPDWGLRDGVLRGEGRADERQHGKPLVGEAPSLIRHQVRAPRAAACLTDDACRTECPPPHHDGNRRPYKPSPHASHICALEPG